MDARHLIYFERAIAFLVICAIVFWMDITPRELAWGLYSSSLVSGVLALMLPLWVLLLFPSLDRKLFPAYEPPEFTLVGRIFACVFATLVFVGPFLLFP